MKKAKRIIDPNKPKIKLPSGKNYVLLKNIVTENNLNTICESGNCPNIAECWGNGTATFLILGEICTRSCKFCSVITGKPLAVDTNEPIKIARTIKLMRLKHCVITSVDRDDLEDGGSIIWEETINKIRELSPDVTIETLIPDFQFNKEQLDRIITAKPEIVSHNLETVERLSKEVRVQARYERSLQVLEYLKSEGIRTKSGIMVGLGETDDEIYKTMDDLLKVDCKIITIGQYLQPEKDKLKVERFVSPEKFNEYYKVAKDKGFNIVESGSLVRSSYHADKHL